MSLLSTVYCLLSTVFCLLSSVYCLLRSVLYYVCYTLLFYFTLTWTAVRRIGRVFQSFPPPNTSHYSQQCQQSGLWYISDRTIAFSTSSGCFFLTVWLLKWLAILCIYRMTLWNEMACKNTLDVQCQNHGRWILLNPVFLWRVWVTSCRRLSFEFWFVGPCRILPIAIIQFVMKSFHINTKCLVAHYLTVVASTWQHPCAFFSLS
jgi:hypothetical protein